MGKKGKRARGSQEVAWTTPPSEMDSVASPSEEFLSGAHIRNTSAAVFGALALLSWIGAHTGESWNGAAGLTYVLTGIAFGLVTPLGGLIFSIFTVPFQGGPVGGFDGVYGVSEFARAAPIWGSIARTLYDLARHGRQTDAPPRLFLVAAIGSMVLAPITRLPSEAYPEYQAGAIGVFVDMLAIIGSQSLMWVAWILSSHLPRSATPAIERAIAVALPIAMIVAVGAFARIPLFDWIAFDGERNGRLAGLGFPTPTAMGIAIALPIAAAVAWRTSRAAAAAMVGAALLTIFLTGSRGPLIATMVSGVVAVLMVGNIPVRFVVLGGAAGLLGTMVLVAQRYGRQIQDLLTGKGESLLSLSDSIRIQSWIAAFEIAVKRPITGAGWMSLRFWDQKFNQTGVAESHNIILLALASGGIPYALTTATGVLGSALRMWRNRHSMPASWIGAATALLVCGVWDMPQTRAFAALYGGVALGLVARSRDNTTSIDAAHEETS